MTIDEQVQAVYDLWGESATNSIVTPSQIAASLNRAQRRLCLIGQLKLTCSTAPFVAAQEVYAFPGQYLKVEYVTVVGSRQLLPMDIAMRDPSNNSAGPPSWYYVWGGSQGGTNVLAIGIWPVPQVVETMDVYFRAAARKVIVSTDPGGPVSCELVEPFQDAMNEFALMDIYRRLGPDWAPLYARQQAEWLKWENEAKNYMNPLTIDMPVLRRDTGGYYYEYSPY